MKIRYSPRARRDIEQIASQLRERNLDGALAVLSAIHRALGEIADDPLKHRRTTRAEIRVTTLARYPYKIFHRASAEFVEIVHVRQTARRPWRSADEAL
jgi:plasmid stabilization system protein ParE